jgi:WD40 repeat protein
VPLDRGEINAIEISADGYLGVACSRGVILVPWQDSTATPEPVALDTGPAGDRARINTSIRFSGDGQTVVAGSMDGRTCGWRVSTGERLWDVRKSNMPITNVAASRDASICYIAAGMGLVFQYVAETQKAMPSYYQSGTIGAIDCSASGEFVVFGGSWDALLRLSLDRQRRPYCFELGLTEAVRTLRLSPDEKLLAVGDSQGGLCVLAMPDIATLPGPENEKPNNQTAPPRATGEALPQSGK